MRRYLWFNPPFALSCPATHKKGFHPLPWEDMYAAHRETGNAQRGACSRRAEHQDPHPLRQFHRWPVGAADARPLLREPHADQRRARLRDRPLDCRGHREGARRRARRGRCLGQDGSCRPRRRPLQDRRPHGGQPSGPRHRRDDRQRQADPRDDGRRPAARRRSLPLFRQLHPRAGRLALGDRRDDHRLPLPRAARRRRSDHPVELPHPHGGVEARPGPRRRQLRRARSRPSRRHSASWC